MRILSLGLVLFVISCSNPKPESDANLTDKNYHIVGYVAGWKTVKANRIPAEKLTHVNYAFADVREGLVQNMEGKSERDSLNFLELHKLKTINPDLKILVSIGGWTHSKGFSEAVSTPEGIKKLTKSGIDFLIKYDLDGLDYDWEYPGLPGDNNPYKPEDKENFVSMLKSFREALDSLGSVTGKKYLSTIASGGFRRYLEVNDLAAAQEYLDVINIMAYDFYTAGDKVTGHHSNLYPHGAKGRSAQTTVEEHIEFGVPSEKLVLGVPFYGRMWKNVPPDENGLFQSGDFEMGLPYHQIFALSKTSHYVRFWDEKASVPYLYSAKDSAWITYEDTESLAEKMKFIKENKLAGAMFWEMSEDNTRSLLNAVYDGLNPKPNTPKN